MKPRLLTCIVVSSLLATSAAARADKEIGLGISYDPRLPLGGLHTLAPNAAVAGIQGKWEYYVVDQRVALGFALQYQYFQHGGESTTVPVQNGAVTAPFTRYAYFISFIPTARWFPFGPATRGIRPWVELGVGATSATSAVLASDLSRRDNGGGLVLQPSAGVLWALVSDDGGSSAGGREEELMLPPRRRESMVAIAASVAWAFTTADVVTAQNVEYVGLQIGLYTKL
jgi:hypothetical protein